MARWLIGADTGGTFTDLIAFDTGTGEIRCAKVPSRPDDPSLAVMAALEEILAADISPGEIDSFVHGSTVATNALLEAKGAITGLIVTRGFTAVYEGRGWSQPSGPDVIDPFYRKPRPLVPLRRIAQVTERVNANGEVLVPLCEDEVRQATRQLIAQGATSIAVCFLYSFLRPRHEQRAAEIIAETAPHVRIALSSDVLPVVREYVRLSTTAVEAYVGPAVETYLDRLALRLTEAGVSTPRIYMMQSNGGLAPIATVGRHASRLLVSGPAAGLIAAAELGRAAGHDNIVTFDMGGTSADIGLVIGGQVRESAGGLIAGQDIGTPMLNVRTLSAGGGTIAWIGKDGLLKVGPASAGASPGPACYGRGGSEPTVTDANLALGILGETALAGGLQLDRIAAERAIEARIARPLGFDTTKAADGIRRIINTMMAVDVRLALQEAGQDPRHFALMAFGGAGALHAAEIAQACGLRQVLVPPRPGLNCAMGLLQTAVRHTYLRSMLGRLSSLPIESFNAVLDELKAQAMNEAGAEGFAPERVAISTFVEMRYLKQGYQLLVPCPYPLSESSRLPLKCAFDDLHRRTYGQAAPAEDAEIVTFRLQSQIDVPKLRLEPIEPGTGNPERAHRGSRQLFDTSIGRLVTTNVYWRDELRAGDSIAGPAVISQFDATTLVMSGQRLVVDDLGTLVIEVSTRTPDNH